MPVNNRVSLGDFISVFPTPTDLTVSLEAEPDGDKVHANVEWEVGCESESAILEMTSADKLTVRKKANRVRENLKEIEKAEFSLFIQITGDDYTRFFKVSWGVIGRNLTEAETSNKTLLIHDLEQNASYTLRVDVYFPVHDGEPVARTSANVSFG